MIYALVIWTVVASDRWKTHWDWRTLVEVSAPTQEAAELRCQKAAAELGIKVEKYRCINTGKKS